MTDRMALTAAEVHVWPGAAADSAQLREPRDSDLAVLSDQERARCRRFVHLADRAHFAVRHAEVRRLLAGYLDVSPAQIRLGRTPCCRCGHPEHGPPRIDWPRTDLTFSQSGSGRHWLLAITRSRRIGVDIEVPREAGSAEVARACLTAAERQYLNSRPQSEWLDLFYRCWTRKEAVLKACGIGLAGALGELDVQPSRGEPVEIRYSCAAGPDLWVVQDLSEQPGPAGGQELAGTSSWRGAVAQPAADAARICLHGRG